MDTFGLIITALILVSTTRADDTNMTHHNHEHNRITITPSTPKVTIFSNTLYFVSCNLPSPDSKLHWRSPEGKIVKAKKGRVHIEETPGKLELFLEPVKMSDQGYWACEQDNGGHKTSFQLNVLEPISFVDKITMMSVKAGQDATMPCEVTGFPTPKVSWHFNGNPIKDLNKFTILEDGIHIRKVGHNDAGEYTCKAFQISESINEIKERTILLKIQHAPEWIPTRNYNKSYAYISGTTNLTCEVRAEPAANFTWHQGKKEKSVKTNHTIHYSPNLSTLQLHVDDSTAFDVYTCIAHNGLGKIKHKIELLEAMKPDSPESVNLRGFNSNLLIVDFGSLKASSKDKPTPIIGYVIQYVNEYDYKKIGFQWNTAQEKYVVFEENAPYIINELEQNTTYVIRAASRNLAGLSDWTRVEKFTTQSTEPPTNSAYLNKFKLNFYQTISTSCALSVFLNYLSNNLLSGFNPIIQNTRAGSMLAL